jgi:hypothetical protein
MNSFTTRRYTADINNPNEAQRLGVSRTVRFTNVMRGAVRNPPCCFVI